MRKIAKQNGFSLIEVVASMVIVGVTVVAVMNMFSAVVKSSEENKNRLIAYTLLHQKAEEIKAKDFNAITADTGSFPGFTGFNYLVNVTYPFDPNSDGVSMKKVVIQVGWQSSFGGAMTESIYFIKAQ